MKNRGHILLAWMLVALMVFIAGCASPQEDPDNDAEAEDKQESVSASTPSPDYTRVNRTESRRELARLTPDMEDFPYEGIEVTTQDGMILQGRLYDPTQLDDPDTAADEDTTYPLVILLHSLNRNHTEWGTLPKQLVAAGFAVLAMDQRGHGASSKNRTSQRIHWRTFNSKDWHLMPQDVGRMIRYFGHEDSDYPQVDASRIALVGSKLGANVSLLAARQYQEHVRAIVLLSPAIAYKGLNVTNAIIEYPNSIFILSSQNDIDSFEAADRLYRWALGPKAIRLYDQAIGGGTDMLHNKPSLKEDITGWLKRHISDEPQPANAPAEKKKAAEPSEKAPD